MHLVHIILEIFVFIFVGKISDYIIPPTIPQSHACNSTIDSMVSETTSLSSPNISPSTFVPSGPPTPVTSVWMDDDNKTFSTPPPSTSFPSGPPAPAASTCRDDDNETSSIPWDGDTVQIIDKADGRALALIDGQLRMEPMLKNTHIAKRGCWHWHVVDRHGWLGFRNGCSGRYLGHDGKDSWNKNLRVLVDHFKGWEHFVAKQHPSGEYLLLMRHWDDLVQVTVNESGRLATVGPKSDRGKIWRFVKVY